MPSSYDIVLRFSRRYSMGHRLISGAAPNCQIPHGHDEIVTVDIASKENRALNPKTNMLIEFEEAKGLWFEWIDQALDHSFQVSAVDPILNYFRNNEPNLIDKILATPGDPTTEIRSACYYSKLTAFLEAKDKGLICIRLQIKETPTNAVEYNCHQVSKFLPVGDEHWWNRPDLSINDL